jgi:hypothetical protein
VLLINDILSIKLFFVQKLGWSVNGDIERVWKEVAVAYNKVLFEIFLGEVRRATINWVVIDDFRRFEAGNSRTRRREAIRWTAMFQRLRSVEWYGNVMAKWKATVNCFRYIASKISWLSSIRIGGKILWNYEQNALRKGRLLCYCTTYYYCATVLLCYCTTFSSSLFFPSTNLTAERKILHVIK